MLEDLPEAAPEAAAEVPARRDAAGDCEPPGQGAVPGAGGGVGVPGVAARGGGGWDRAAQPVSPQVTHLQECRIVGNYRV